VSGTVSSKLDSASSHDTGSDGPRTSDHLDGSADGRGGSSRDKRGSKSVLLNAFSAALKRRQSNEMSSIGSSPRRSLVSSSPEDLEDRRSDELNRRNRSNVRSNEKLNNNSADYNNPESEDDVVRQTHIIAQRLNRASVDLTGSSPKRRLNSVSWVTPESESDQRPPTQNARSPTSGPYTAPHTLEPISPQTSPDAAPIGSNFESGSAGNSRASSFGDVRARELSLSTIDEEATGNHSRMGPPRTEDQRRGPAGVVMRSKQAPPPSSSSSQGTKSSRRLTLPSLITVPQPLITVSSPEASGPISGQHSSLSYSFSHQSNKQSIDQSTDQSINQSIDRR